MTTQPLLLLGGAPGPDPSATDAAWEKALAEPTVRGWSSGERCSTPRRQRGRGRRGGGRAGRAGGGEPTMINHPWYVPAGSAADGTASVAIDPGRAGWTYCGLTVRTLPEDGVTFATGGTEQAVLPLSGPVTVEVEGRRFELAGRNSVFSAVTDWAYLPVDAEVRLSGPGSEVALPAAVATRRFDPVMVGAIDIAIEIRAPERQHVRSPTSCRRRRSTAPTS